MDGSNHQLVKHPVTPSLGGHECDFARLTRHHSFGQTREAASWLGKNCVTKTFDMGKCCMSCCGGDGARNDLGRGL